jgi:predicted DNA-binding transcriptional regulator AlpA
MAGKTSPITTTPKQEGELQILTVQQVANRLQIPASSVYEKTRFRGATGPTPLPARRVGKYLRFIAAEIDAWLLSLPQAVKRTKRPYRRKKSGA